MYREQYLESIYSNLYPEAPKVYMGDGTYLGRDIANSNPQISLREIALVGITGFIIGKLYATYEGNPAINGDIVGLLSSFMAVGMWPGLSYTSRSSRL